MTVLTSASAHTHNTTSQFSCCAAHMLFQLGCLLERNKGGKEGHARDNDGWRPRPSPPPAGVVEDDGGKTDNLDVVTQLLLFFSCCAQTTAENATISRAAV